MPRYKTHTNFNVLLLPLLGFLIMRYWGLREVMLFSAGYIFSTYFMSPDVDVYKSGPVRRWRYFSVLWLPYSILFSHRGLSHIPIIGTLTRLAYLGVVSLIISLIVVGDADTVERWVKVHAYDIGWIAGGIFVADTLHVILDGVFSWLKRRV